MALPLGWLVSISVSGEGGVTLAHYWRVFGDPALQRALWNTIVLAFWVGLASIAVGAPLAWLTVRTDLPGQGDHPLARPGVVRHAALPGRLCLGDARGPQCGVPQCRVAAA